MSRRRREPETATIVGLTAEGHGIADTDGKKVFVVGALPGETVRFRRRKSRRKFDEAELLDVIEASAERIDPRCAVFGRCGGCALQHIAHQKQLDTKAQSLRDALERIGRVRAERWLAPLSGPIWHYRRRARLAVKNVEGKGRVLVGFREKHAPFITDMLRCEVLADPVGALIEPLSAMIGRLSIRARIPQIEVAVAENGVALVFRTLDAPNADDSAALRQFAEKHALRIYLQPKGLDTVALFHPPKVDEALYYSLPAFNVRIEFEPSAFVQINAEVNRALVELAVGLLAPAAHERILDLYCGLGNFSLPLARRASRVLGVEGDGLLVEQAVANSRLNGLSNAEFACHDLSMLEGSEPWLSAGWDAVLLDPARSGAWEVVNQIGRTGARRIVYVSCNPGTLARDAECLVKRHGFVLEAAGIVDMFPHTAHVESIAVFKKMFNYK